MTNTRATESLVQLSAEVGLTLPPSTHVLGVRRISGGMDDALKLKIELPASALPTLLNQTGIPAESFEPGTGGLLGPDREFWDPHQAPALRTGQAKRAGGRVLNVGVDDSRPGLAVLFIMVHET